MNLVQANMFYLFPINFPKEPEYIALIFGAIFGAISPRLNHHPQIVFDFESLIIDKVGERKRDSERRRWEEWGDRLCWSEFVLLQKD